MLLHHLINGQSFNGISFSRASTGTYIDDGLLKTAAVNEPRYEDTGLLIEPVSENVTRPSENWVASAGATGGNAYVHTARDAEGWRTVTGGTDTGRAEGTYRDFAEGNNTLQNKNATVAMDVKKPQVSIWLACVCVGRRVDGLGC